MSHNINPGLINKLVTITDAHNKLFKNDVETLAMVSALAITFGQSFQTKLKDFWPTIQHGLGAVNEPELFKKAVSTVGDLGRSY